jgi:hypothetical protein
LYSSLVVSINQGLKVEKKESEASIEIFRYLLRVKKLVILFQAALLFIALQLPAQLPAYVPASGLQGFWPLNGNGSDLSGNGWNGQINGCASALDRHGNLPGCYSFNGSSDYISTSYPGVLSTTPRAVSFWAKTTQSTQIMSAVAWGDQSGTASRYECGFNYGATGPMLDGGNGCMTYSANVPFYDGKWHHFVVQFGANNSLTNTAIYMDTVLLTLPASVYNPGNLLSTTSGFNVLFGKIAGSVPHFFNGSIDEVGIWNRRLLHCEIRELFLASKFPALQVPSGVTGCVGQNVNISVAGAATYLWSNGATGSVISIPATNTVLSVTGFSAGCTNSGSISITAIECTGLPSSPAEGFTIRPNPCRDYIFMEGTAEMYSLELVSPLGVVLKQQDLSGPEAEIDLRDLSPGTYLIRLRGNRGALTRRIIKY